MDRPISHCHIDTFQQKNKFCFITEGSLSILKLFRLRKPEVITFQIQWDALVVILLADVVVFKGGLIPTDLILAIPLYIIFKINLTQWAIAFLG